MLTDPVDPRPCGVLAGCCTSGQTRPPRDAEDDPESEVRRESARSLERLAQRLDLPAS